MAMFRLDPWAKAARCDDAAFREVELADFDPFAARDESVAVIIGNDADLVAMTEILRARLRSVDAVILQFPDFRDGRAYSQARLLRQRIGFEGDIIARGDVLRDQALLMARCGFTIVETDRSCAADLAESLLEFSAFYQRASDGQEPVWSLRHERSAQSGRAAA
ncbi:MAG: DUF934 domain-containing protein [Alphaproteobacteria bacterium]|nr:DUF934 domain-containing protein [Alphaproteobacteria bacterium]